MTDLNFPYEDLWYIKLINETDKNPLETWGGYSQDFAESDTVYSHVEVLESDHENWGVVGIKDEDRYLLIFDLDVHKAPEDFDVDSVSAPNETPIVRSQSGGLHVYFVVDADNEGKESDFEMTYDLDWDIDIRGSYVKHHVVAPADIPGGGGKYDLANDETLLTVHNPGDATDRIRYLGDPESEKSHGEPLLKHSPGGGGFGGSVAIDRDVKPPEEMPTCYHRGLQVRAANPDDPNVNTHKVNTLTALCGLAAGYSTEDMVTHFCEDFAPGANADVVETEYQLKTMARKMDRNSLAPPSISTLREYGILEDDETCDCHIEYHGGTAGAGSPVFDVIEEAKAATDRRDTVQAEADGGEVAADGQPDDFGLPGEPLLQERVQDVLRTYDNSDDMTQKTVVHRVAQVIVDEESFVYPPKNARQWRSVLYRYDAGEGIYRPDGKRYAEELCERLLGDFLNNTQASELVGKIKRMSGVRRERLKVEPHRLVVGNGILDLHRGELEPWTPDEHHRTKIAVEYHPGAGCPRIDEFFHEIVEDKDVRTLYQLAAHGLYRDYAAEKAAMLVGGGQNGKSVFLDLLEHLLGSDNVTHRSLQELSHDDFAAAELHGRLANFHPDMSGEKIEDLGMFKKLTGRDTMLANVKYEQPIKFENYASLIFAANTMPEMDEDTHALWRRWIYINFPFKFDDSDPDAKDKTPKRVLMRELTTEDELEGLLARCVKEIVEWWDGRNWFTNTMGADAVRKKMKRAGEPVFAFATTCLEADEDGALRKDEVRECYRRYARAEDLPTESDNVFGEKILKIQDLPIESARQRFNGTRQRVYTGVAWSSRGEQLMNINPTGRGDTDQALDKDGGTRGRQDKVMEAMRSLGADKTPVSRGMILGRASNTMDLKQAEYALDTLCEETRAVYSPADADESEWMLK